MVLNSRWHSTQMIVLISSHVSLGLVSGGPLFVFCGVVVAFVVGFIFRRELVGHLSTPESFARAKKHRLILFYEKDIHAQKFRTTQQQPI